MNCMHILDIVDSTLHATVASYQDIEVPKFHC